MKRINTHRTIATVAVVAALLTGCGADGPGQIDDTDSDSTTNAAWSDQARAERDERAAQLGGQARTYRAAGEATGLARAEALERQAKFAGQANTYAAHASTGTRADEPPSGEFLPGSRHVPTR